MVLDMTQIKEIVISNPNKELIINARKYATELRKHFFGENLEATLLVIEGFEKKALRELRVKYAKSNKDLFSRLSRPIDKVFSARGGSVYYNLGERLDNSAAALAMNIRDGYPLKKWIEMFWKPYFLSDPNSVIFIEVDAEQNAYPTYKSTSVIFDYKPKGVLLDYIVFEVSKAELKQAGIDEQLKVYRVVDDLFDRYVKVEGESVTEIAEHTFPNYFMQVPGIINSDISNPQRNNAFLSLFDEIIDMANLFLVKGSIRVTHDFMHAFPKYWEYADSCNECKGTGYKESDECKTCKGTGKSIMTKVSDTKLLSYPEAKEDVVVTPNVAGYVTPPKDYYEISTGDLNALEDAMTFTIWGTHRKQSGANTGDAITATQAFIDVQPVNDRLTAISEAAEKRHKFIIDKMIDFKIKKGYSGASINYGRRYLIESADAVWNRYSSARGKAPVKVLNDLLVEYIEAKYNGDPVSMNIQLKLMNVEPFVHNTISEVKAFMPDEKDLLAKLYFGEWLTTKNNNELLVKSTQELRDDLATYTSEKTLQKPDLVTFP